MTQQFGTWITMMGVAMAKALLMVLPTSAQTQPQTAQSDPFQYPTYTGRMVCESKVVVTIVEDKKRPHFFDVAIGKAHYKTQRLPTESGAIRLEDKSHGIVWLQMANKSMLLNEKLGKRMADNCRNDLQLAAEQALLANPDTNLLGKP